MVAILLATYNLLRLIATLASPYAIDHITNLEVGTSFAEYQGVWQKYLAIESNRLQMSPDSLTILMFYSGCMAAGYIIFSFFLARRKKFAKYWVTGLLFVEIVVAIVVGIQYCILPTKLSSIVAIFMLLFFSSATIAKEFT